MPHIKVQDLKELREKTFVKVEDEKYAVYLIPKEYVSEYFTHGKPERAIAKLLGKELAKEAWGMNEGDAIDERVRQEATSSGKRWKTIVYQLS